MISDFKKKILISLVIVAILSIAISVFQHRFIKKGEINRKTAGLTADVRDKSGQISFTKGRFNELYHAIEIANSSPLIGLGPWGFNKPRVTKHEQGDFVHSSFIHMYVKIGLLGLICYCWIILSYMKWWSNTRRLKWNEPGNKLLAEAFFCGFLFWIPDALFGTPIIIYRHFQILAIIFIIPFIAYKIDIQQINKIQNGI